MPSVPLPPDGACPSPPEPATPDPSRRQSPPVGAPARELSAPGQASEERRAGVAARLAARVEEGVRFGRVKPLEDATARDVFFATARAARDELAAAWQVTRARRRQEGRKRVYFLSLEFLLGRLLEDGLCNLGLRDDMARALADLGRSLDEVALEEPETALGNGGLGRLSACLLDSLATADYAAMGYGIRYAYGTFEQAIAEGRQVERVASPVVPENPWEVVREDRRYRVQFGGRVATLVDDVTGRVQFEWVETEDVWALAYDVPVPGYRNGVVNTLRLWSAQATPELGARYTREGDYVTAVEEKHASEHVSRVLYPSDMTVQRAELRLRQEYFFVSATVQDALARHSREAGSFHELSDRAVFQLNDTHPALAVAELMRLLIDVHELDWEDAWDVTRRSVAFTNHTLLPEALETWPVWMLERVLPRHLQIIYEINARFLADVRAHYPGDEARVQRVSLFDELGEKRLRAAHLALVGSFSVNGVSQLHSRILRQRVFRDFGDISPHKFRSVTNGVTPRRWLMHANPALARLATSRLGSNWVTRLEELERLLPLAEDASFREEWQAARAENKRRLRDYVRARHGIELHVESLFDVHVKRIHEYKRQLLNVLHVVALYLELREQAPPEVPSRTFLFGGKAAPGYEMAKRTVQLISAVAAVVNADPRVNGQLRVEFLPNYDVSLAERIIPAADVSEQISMAGTEASGTGNMKFQLNGALTVGSLDGANLEILEAVGEDAMFVFGLSAGEVDGLKARGYRPREIYQEDAELRAVLDTVAGGVFSPNDRSLFRPLIDELLTTDRYLVLADFQSYRQTHRRVARAFLDRELWTRRSIRNTARSGRFSSDTAVRAYARDVWELS